MGESMAADAIAMGLDMVVGPDGREWSESAYVRPRINRELWGDFDDDDDCISFHGKKISLDLDDYYGSDDKYQNLSNYDNKISIIKNTNYYFFENLNDAIKFSFDNKPSILKIGFDGCYFVYFESNDSSKKLFNDVIIDDEIICNIPDTYVKETVRDSAYFLIDSLGISQIACKRELTESTIINHIVELGNIHNIYFDYLKPSDLIIGAVEKARKKLLDEKNPFNFLSNGDVRLRSVADLLNNEFFDISFSDIQLALLFLDRDESTKCNDLFDDDVPF